MKVHETQYLKYEFERSKATGGLEKIAFDLAEQWADLMDQELNSGQQLKNVWYWCWKHDMKNPDGMGYAAHIIAYYWHKGEEFRLLYNRYRELEQLMAMHIYGVEFDPLTGERK